MRSRSRRQAAASKSAGNAAPNGAEVKETGREPIAVVGIGCVFPGGCEGPEALWQALKDGRDLVTTVPSDRWNLDAHYSADPSIPGKTVTRWGGFLDKVKEFDAAFFGISPREATLMDPQQRLLLQVAWEALEDAGIPVESLEGSATGVFVGISYSDYHG